MVSAESILSTVGPEYFSGLAESSLQPDVRRIDQEGFYPKPFLQALGAAGGFAAHAKNPEGIGEGIRITAEIGRYCGSTAFLLWCQNACVWYLANTGNVELRERYLGPVSTGEIIGATAFSNPMKHYAGFEEIKLKGRQVDGGYVVNGVLPWVSNLGPAHVFGTVIDSGEEKLAALVRVDGEAIRLGPSGRFTALEGTATYSLRFENAFLPNSHLLAPRAEPFIDRIRPGFILLQLGIGFGIIRGALEDIARANRKLGEFNRVLPDQPENLQRELDVLEAHAATLGTRPLDAGSETLRSILRLRLATAELTSRAAFSALQHAGALGFLADSSPQRRVREALFFTILTPSTKQLRRSLASS